MEPNLKDYLTHQTSLIISEEERNLVRRILFERSDLNRVCLLPSIPPETLLDKDLDCVVDALMKLSRIRIAFENNKLRLNDKVSKSIVEFIDMIYNSLMGLCRDYSGLEDDPTNPFGGEVMKSCAKHINDNLCL